MISPLSALQGWKAKLKKNRFAGFLKWIPPPTSWSAWICLSCDFLTDGTMVNYHENIWKPPFERVLHWKWRFGRWFSFSVGCFLGSMLNFRGVSCIFVPSIWRKSKIESIPLIKLDQEWGLRRGWLQDFLATAPKFEIPIVTIDLVIFDFDSFHLFRSMILSHSFLGVGFKYLFMFNPIWGRFPDLTNIFQVGWNHQPVFIVLFFSFESGLQVLPSNLHSDARCEQLIQPNCFLLVSPYVFIRSLSYFLSFPYFHDV